MWYIKQESSPQQLTKNPHKCHTKKPVISFFVVCANLASFDLIWKVVPRVIWYITPPRHIEPSSYDS